MVAGGEIDGKINVLEAKPKAAADLPWNSSAHNGIVEVLEIRELHKHAGLTRLWERLNLSDL